MNRYVITCEFYRPKRAAAVADTIRKLARQWEHPLSGVWIVKTALSASDIRSALLVHLDFQDRFCICEAGGDAAEFNTLPASGGKITQFEPLRSRSRMLSGIFSRNGKVSRHLMAATSGNLKSA